MRTWAQAGVLACVSAFAISTVALAETAVYTPQEMRVLGYQMMAAGDAAAANAIADALLQRDPKDAAALLLRAQARLNDGPAARAAAKLAYRTAPDKETQYSAAMFIANSLASEGRNSFAQLWLRRAAQVSPDQGTRALARDGYDAVRSRNPLVFAFDVAVRPSSNVNNGSSATSYKNPGIPWLPADIPLAGEDLALSGTVASVNADVTYRLPPTQTTRTELSLHFDHSMVWLSDAAKAIAPTAKAENYAMASVEAGLTRFYRGVDSKVTYRFGGYLGHDWSAGKPLSDRLRVEASADWAIRPDLHGFGSLSAEKTTRLDSSVRSSEVLGLTLGLSKTQDNGDSWQFALSQRTTTSDSPGIQSDAVSARLAWRKADPVAGVNLSASAVAELRNYPLSPFAPADGRHDEKLGLTVTFDLTEIDYMGFSPSINLTASQTKSNVALFSAREIGLNIGFKSNF